VGVDALLFVKVLVDIMLFVR